MIVAGGFLGSDSRISRAAWEATVYRLGLHRRREAVLADIDASGCRVPSGVAGR